MSENIEKIRPQSKRKAANALQFAERYMAEAQRHRERGNDILATKYADKSLYWMGRFTHHMRLSHTWGDAE